MFKIIDRYILLEFWKFFLIALTSVVFIYTIINMFEKLNYFLHYKVTLLDFLKYYLYILPSFISLLFPVGVILSIFMVTGRMVKNNEINALLSSGVSLYRIFLPFVLSGVVVTFIHFVGAETIMRKANSLFYELKEIKIEKRKRRARKKFNIFYYGEHGTVFFIKYIDAEKNIAKNITMWRINEERKIVERLDAEVGRYENGKWIAEEVVVRKFDEDREEIKKKKLIVISELDASPEILVKRVKKIEELYIHELGERKERLRRAGIDVTQEDVDFQFRISTPFINLVMLLLSLPLSVRIRKQGMTFGIGLGLLFSFIFWGVLQTFKAFGYADLLSPVLSAWGANLIFGTVGLGLMFINKT